MKRLAMSIGFGLAAVILLFTAGVLLISASSFDPNVIYYSQLPFRLPYVIDRLFFSPSLRELIMPDQITASVYVYGLNTLIYSIPFYYLLGYLKKKRTSSSPATDGPPPPPSFE